MKTQKTFPSLKDHYYARCFSCGHPLNGIVKIHNSDKQQYEQKCNACEKTTIYHKI